MEETSQESLSTLIYFLQDQASEIRLYMTDGSVITLDGGLAAIANESIIETLKTLQLTH